MKLVVGEYAIGVVAFYYESGIIKNIKLERRLIMGKKIKDDFFDEDNVESKDFEKVEEIQKDSHEYKEFPNMYFVFIDVLGFKKTIDEHRDAMYREKDKTCSGEFEEKYKNIFCKYFDFVDILGKEISNDAFYTGQISDSLFFYTSNIGVLSQYIDILLNFLLYAMSEGVFLRGGITKGRLYVDRNHKNQYYGDCVAYAYLLESSVAKYPRIMVDTQTYQDLSEAYEKVSKDEFQKRANIFKTKADKNVGRQWLNNFYCLENQSIYLRDKQNRELKDLCLEINKSIDLNIEKKEFENSTYEKYISIKKEFDETYNKCGGGKHD